MGVAGDRVRVSVPGGQTSAATHELDANWGDYARRFFPKKDDAALAGRMSHCFMGCGDEQPSSFDLPFFVRGEERDTHYDGCKGWD